jgi:hypothetical protein
MSDTPSNESHEQKPTTKSHEKLTMIFVVSALLLTLVNTVLIVMNPTAKKVEQFNEELKTELAETVASFHKKVDGLRLKVEQYTTSTRYSLECPTFCCCQLPQATGSIIKI